MAFNSLSNSKVFYFCSFGCVPCSIQLGYEFALTLPVYRQLSNANTQRHDRNPHRSAEHYSRCKYNSEHYVNSQKPQVDGKVQKTEICIHNANVNTSSVRFVRALHPNCDELRSLFAATRKWIKTKIECTWIYLRVFQRRAHPHIAEAGGMRAIVRNRIEYKTLEILSVGSSCVWACGRATATNAGRFAVNEWMRRADSKFHQIIIIIKT